MLCLAASSGLAPAWADDFAEASRLFKAGRQDQALEHVNRVIAAKSADAHARFLKGLILTDKGQTSEAIDIFTRLTQDYPGSPEPYNNLAVIYAEQGQYEKARVALEQSVRARPNFATAQENLGDVYAKLAGQAYDKALQLDASNSAAKKKLLLARSVFGAAAPEGTDGPSEVLATARGWAQAWARRDADAFLWYYGADFKPPDGASRAAWEKMRRQRLAGSRVIAVDLESPVVTMAGSDRASVSFRQLYRSQLLNTSTRKTLVLARVDGRWQIREEIVGR